MAWDSNLKSEDMCVKCGQERITNQEWRLCAGCYTVHQVASFYAQLRLADIRREQKHDAKSTV